VLQGVESLAQAPADPRGAERAQVEPAAVLGVGERPVHLGRVPVESPRVVEPPRRLLDLDDAGGQRGPGGIEQVGDLVGELLDGAPGVARLHRGREHDVDQHADHRADDRLDDPPGPDGLRTGRVADTEHEHRADRHLDQVRAEPEDLAHHDGRCDEGGEAPPCEPDERDEQHREGNAADDAQHPLDAVDERAREGRLHDEERGEPGDERWRVPQPQQLGHHEGGDGRAGEAPGPEDGRSASLANPTSQLGDEPPCCVPRPPQHADHPPILRRRRRPGKGGQDVIACWLAPCGSTGSNVATVANTLGGLLSGAGLASVYAITFTPGPHGTGEIVTALLLSAIGFAPATDGAPGPWPARRMLLVVVILQPIPACCAPAVPHGRPSGPISVVLASTWLRPRRHSLDQHESYRLTAWLHVDEPRGDGLVPRQATLGR
jgi:hypothetical protein